MVANKNLSTIFIAFILLLPVAVAAQEKRVVTVARFAPFQMDRDGGLEGEMEAAISARLSRDGFQVKLTPAWEPSAGMAPGIRDSWTVVGGFYTKGRTGALIIFAQIYDPVSGNVIDALDVPAAFPGTEDLALPADEFKEARISLVAKLAERVSSRLRSNPQRNERPENVHDSLLAHPLGKSYKFPVRRPDESASASEVFRLLEDQIVVTATRTNTKLKDAPAAVYVINAQEIRERGYRTLVDALADVPGFDIIRVYGIFPDLIHQRGLIGNNQRTLVYVDGIPDNNISENAALGGTVRFPLDNVERIEVVSGPSSALYGANAFNGVINIISKNSKGPSEADISATGGWWEPKFRNPGGGGSISARGAKDVAGLDFQYSASFYYLKSQGPNFGDVQHLNNKRNGANDVSYWIEDKACGGTCKPTPTSTGYWWSDGFNVANEETYNVTARFSSGGFRFETINWQYLQGDGTFANGTQQIDQKGRFFKGSNWDFQNNTMAAGYLQKFSDKVTLDSEITARHTSILSSSHEEYPNLTTPDAYYRPGDTTFLSTYSRPDQEYDLREKLYWEQSAHANLTVGLERSHFVVPRGYGDFQRFGYTNDAAYLQQVWSPWMWLTLTGGIRYDKNTIYGASDTPRISAVIRPNEELTLKVLLSTGFRAPTAHELYDETAQRRANPYLEPERLRSAEAGIAYRFAKRYYVSANAYCNRITDLLLEVQTNEPNPKSASGGNYNQNQNVGRAVICGTEVASDLQITKKFKIFINYTYNKGMYEKLPTTQTASPSTKGRPGDDLLFDAYAAAYKQALNRDIVPENGPIPNIGQHHANAGVTWYPIASLSMHLRANYVDLRRTVATNPQSTVKGYTMVDANIHKEDFIFSGMFAQLEINNLINEQYFDPGIRTATGGYYPTQHPLERRNMWLSLGYRF